MTMEPQKKVSVSSGEGLMATCKLQEDKPEFLEDKSFST